MSVVAAYVLLFILLLQLDATSGLRVSHSLSELFGPRIDDVLEWFLFSCTSVPFS